jgi:hypothetical protein
VVLWGCPYGIGNIFRYSLDTDVLHISKLEYQKLNTRKEECVRRIDIMNIAALVGLVMLLLFVGGGIAIWLLFTSKLPQSDYRMGTRKSLISVAVCGIMFLLVYICIRVLNTFFP